MFRYNMENVYKRFVIICMLEWHLLSKIYSFWSSRAYTGRVTRRFVDTE